MKKEVLSQFASELSQSAPGDQQRRVFYARKFLAFAGDRPFSEWNKALVNGFLEELRRDSYAPGTVRWIYGIVKRVFDAAKAVHEAERIRLISEADPKKPGAIAEVLQAMALPGPVWDLGKRSAPKVEKEDEVKPACTLEEIKAMVEAGRELVPEAAYLGLSSIYGLRAGELRQVRQEHLDFAAGTIYIMTEKGGEKRNQLLCPEIIPVLKEYPFNREISSYQMWVMYKRICAKAGIIPKEGEAWHAVRRYLDTELVNIFGEQNRIKVKIFLRWKISSSSDMSERYYGNSPLAIDQEILNRHPVVPLWR